MGEELSNTMNLDLNLGPDLVELIDLTSGGGVNREGETLRRFRRRLRPRFRQIEELIPVNPVIEGLLPVLADRRSPVIELSQLLITGGVAGEGSLAGGERVDEEEELKKCENGGKVIEEENVTEEKKDVEKSGGSEGSFFDCYVCLDLAKDPVVTNCGHLYCWSCLYHWLQVSEAKECPVCKGEISVKTLTPIYGRGKNKRESEEVVDTKIPSRPRARRVESLRTSLHRSGFIPTEMIRHFHDRLERESSTGERRVRPFLNRFMTSRGVRAEQNQSSVPLVEPLDDTDLTSNISPEHEGENGNQRPNRSFAIRRHFQAQRAEGITSISSMLGSAQRVMDAYLRRHSEEQNNVAPAGGEDRDSFSSVVGVMNTESQSQVDAAAEIDSMLTVSSSSSVRRPEHGPRVSDVDSADSRPLRRRRRLA